MNVARRYHKDDESVDDQELSDPTGRPEGPRWRTKARNIFQESEVPPDSQSSLARLQPQMPSLETFEPQRKENSQGMVIFY